MESIFKNKLVWFVVVGFIIIPLILNVLILIPALFPIVGDDKIWLSFWGGYLGAIISSFVAVYILNRQLRQNHEENEANRKLQLTNVDYQLQKEWLSKVREACIVNIFSYNTNEIVDVLNTIRLDRYEAFFLSKKLLFNLAKTDTNVAFLVNEDTSVRLVFNSQRKHYFKEYSSLINDIQLVVASLINSIDKSFSGYCLYIETNGASEAFVNAITKHVINNELTDVVNIFEAATNYIDKCCPNYFEEIRKLTLEYLNKEKYNTVASPTTTKRETT